MAFMAKDILALVSFVSVRLLHLLTPSLGRTLGYSPESPRDMSPDAISPYPERPIRPLPKRRLRERLSPDVAESIKYPPAPKTTTPLFYHPYNLREDAGANGLVESQHPSERERADELERGYITRKCGDELDSDEDEAAYRSRIYSRHSETTTGRSYRYVQKPDPKNSNPQPPASIASSADGYDSFENTNNKKKRKIPTPGDSLNGTHLSSEMAGMGISSPDDLADDIGGGIGSYHSPGSAVSQGLSGPGRGRYGRIRNGRSPLRTLSDSNWGNGRTVKQRQAQWPLTTETPGIISKSIADANAQKHPITPARGQENVSLLQQQASKKSTTASTQFTFTCDSQVPGTVAWPGPTTAPMHQSPAAARMSTHATQTSPNMPASLNAPITATHAKQGLASSQHNPGSSKQPPPQAAPPKKTRRRTGKEYLIAARKRRLQQQKYNDHYPPAAEDIWVCEFCEYERIFGTPPEALIKQYEIKDRRVRKQEAERRRLLEKAKMKGRKGKKGNKSAAKTPAAAHDRQATHQQTQQSTPMNLSQSQGTQSEEYYEDEFDDEYAQDDPPPPSPTAPPTNHQHQHESVRPAPLKHGGGGGNAIPVA
ncbi:hypothetical protein LSUB1_G000157 [Lachnellula subtilissima]|uniref:Protein IBD2 n=1 Tax=Lachnellula subtilissima TaxID=602034 RepID=A0A8H8UIS4_9HELO|nr:hypothetical protein LSUB1_G000157 [Lachnellula subtilissima]